MHNFLEEEYTILYKWKCANYSVKFPDFLMKYFTKADFTARMAQIFLDMPLTASYIEILKSVHILL